MLHCPIQGLKLPLITLIGGSQTNVQRRFEIPGQLRPGESASDTKVFACRMIGGHLALLSNDEVPI